MTKKSKTPKNKAAGAGDDKGVDERSSVGKTSSQPSATESSAGKPDEQLPMKTWNWAALDQDTLESLRSGAGSWNSRFLAKSLTDLNLKWASSDTWNELQGTKLIVPDYTQFLANVSPSADTLEADIRKLKERLVEQAAEAAAAAKRAGEAADEAARFRKTAEELAEKERLSFVRHRVRREARELLVTSQEFRAQFLDARSCQAFVMSVDIRRSTELMLKARSPQLFADFITVLAGKLVDLVLAENGVFDKFTGDGILAFFPDFYSGPDAGFHAVAAADKCHRLFAEHYAANRVCFTSVLKDVGLGIGIDYGTTHLVRMGDGLTVVGTPVVYACRMGNGAAGQTVLNQPAFEEVFARYSAYCSFVETEIESKHEGKHVAYSVTLNGKSFKATSPDWLRPSASSGNAETATSGY